MIKRVVVAGCRNHRDYSVAKDYIFFCISGIRKKYTLVFVSGGCAGADMLGERFALENGFKLERYPAEWGKYGRAAGPRRNMEMVKASDFVICFWDGKSRGTKSTIEYTVKMGRPLRIKYI